jgi:hypothetical protein
MVAPIALYPDDLLAQTLVASTYPLEIVQLQQWMAKNPNLKDKALADSVKKMPWDPSIQSMAAVPEVVKRLADDIHGHRDGEPFAQQKGHGRRQSAEERRPGRRSNEQKKVDTRVVENKTVIVVQSADPEVIYVHINPTYVYPPPVYPYPRSTTRPTTRGPRSCRSASGS